MVKIFEVSHARIRHLATHFVATNIFFFYRKFLSADKSNRKTNDERFKLFTLFATPHILTLN